MDLDVTGLASSLGMQNAFGAVAPGSGESGQTMQAVLTSALVNEYLRCSSQLQKYQSKHGLLPNAPQCNPGFAEALLTGLKGSSGAGPTVHGVSPRTRASSPPSRVAAQAGSTAPAATAGDQGGTPNFADRLAAASSQLAPGETSPAATRNNPFAESQKAAAGSAGSSGSSQEAQPELMRAVTGTPSQPPPPSAAALDRCHTIDLAPSPEVDRVCAMISGAADCSAARGEDLDSSINDPPWLRQIRK